MTIKQTYYKVQDQCNKLVSNTQQVIPKHIFVQVFNEQQLHWVETCYKVDERNKSEIHKIQQLLVSDEKINSKLKEELYTIFNFPENYFKYSSSFSKIDKCPFIIENHLRESHNKAAILKNPDWIPSLKFEETVLFISDNKFLVLRNEELDPVELHLTYYRFPIEVNMYDGHIDFDGKQTVDIDPEWTGSNLEEIIDLTARQISTNYGDMLSSGAKTQNIQETQIRI